MDTHGSVFIKSSILYSYSLASFQTRVIWQNTKIDNSSLKSLQSNSFFAFEYTFLFFANDLILNQAGVVRINQTIIFLGLFSFQFRIPF